MKDNINIKKELENLTIYELEEFKKNIKKIFTLEVENKEVNNNE